jgi:TrmH family RNA methyltransferase
MGRSKVVGQQRLVGKAGKVRKMKKASSMQLKNIRRLLKEKKVRDFEGLFAAEGGKIVRDAFLKGRILDSVFASSSYVREEENKEFILQLEKKNVPVFEVARAAFDKISSLQHSQGVLAVIKRSEIQKSEIPEAENVFCVLCDGVQDPGNLGTIIRASLGMGADAVILTGDHADVFNPKVVRASSGTILDIPVVDCSPDGVDRLKEKGYRLLASQVTEENARPISELKDIPKRAIIAFGSEGRGISKEILKRADQLFFIPISKKVESLNVVSAVAITLYAIRYMLSAKK